MNNFADDLKTMMIAYDKMRTAWILENGNSDGFDEYLRGKLDSTTSYTTVTA